MSYDFNEVTEAELIPLNTVAKARLILKPGGNSFEDPWVRISMTGNEYLDCEFVILEGQYAKRKVFHKIGLKGNETWVQMSRRFIKNLLESANGLSRYDKSSESEKFRRINSWAELDGLEVVIRIGIEAQPNYPERNKILAVLTAEHPEYKRIMSASADGIPY